MANSMGHLFLRTHLNTIKMIDLPDELRVELEDMAADGITTLDDHDLTFELRDLMRRLRVYVDAEQGPHGGSARSAAYSIAVALDGRGA
jgi:hypothetical protein